MKLFAVALLMAVGLTMTTTVACAEDAEAPKKMVLDLGDGVTMRLVLVPAGKFQMGSPDDEKGRKGGEGPRHEVTISKPFYMGVCEVSQKQWLAIMDIKPWDGMISGKPGDDYAASWMNWHEANEFCQKLAKKTGKKINMPTEAQWEYACRAGSDTMFCFGDDLSKLGEYAWFADNCRKTNEPYAHAIGTKKPNAWGLHDMHGNVWEWCRDKYSKYPEDGAARVDPVDTSDSKFQAVRGGSWHNDVVWLRSASRCSWNGKGYRHYNYGFLVMIEPE